MPPVDYPRVSAADHNQIHDIENAVISYMQGHYNNLQVRRYGQFVTFVKNNTKLILNVKRNGKVRVHMTVRDPVANIWIKQSSHLFYDGFRVTFLQEACLDLFRRY